MRGSLAARARDARVAYEAVREHVPMLRDVGSWDPDIEGLVEAISRGELSARISAEIGGLEGSS